VIVKEVPPTVFVVSSHDDVTIPEIPAIARSEVDQMLESLSEEGIVPAGLMNFIYHGADGSKTTRFRLDLAVPVAVRPASVPEPYELMLAPTFKCVATDFVGPMDDILRGYARLFAAMDKLGLGRTEESREIYKHWVGYESDDNVTELQIGVR
jgi:hypothetical protein